MSHKLKFKFKEGRKVFFELHNGRQYRGNFVESSQFRITINNTIQLPEKVLIPGNTHFFKKELLLINRLPKKDDDISDSEEELNVPIPEPKFSHFDYWTKNSQIWSYISILNEDFDICLQNLRGCDTIAVHGIGHNGRKHSICLLTLVTKLNVYIIDISICCSDVFERGIKNILQSQLVCKIIYNGAMLIDCLYNIHNIKLVNYFDIQVADKIINKNKEPMRKLSSLLIEYINMPEKEAQVLDNFDLESLFKKPVEKSILKDAVKSVAYFIPIKDLQKDIILKDFKIKNDYCLNRTREKSPISALVNTSDILEEFKQMDLKN